MQDDATFEPLTNCSSSIMIANCCPRYMLGISWNVFFLSPWLYFCERSRTGLYYYTFNTSLFDKGFLGSPWTCLDRKSERGWPRPHRLVDAVDAGPGKLGEDPSQDRPNRFKPYGPMDEDYLCRPKDLLRRSVDP